jgi:hypothetical protein
LKIGLFLWLLGGLSAASFAGHKADPVEIQMDSTSYRPGEPIALKLVNTSTSTVHYVIDHRVKIAGKWRGSGPYDIEEPNRKSKSVRLHVLKAGQQKVIHWTEPEHTNGERIESIQFVTSLFQDAGSSAMKVYSPEIVSAQ